MSTWILVANAIGLAGLAATIVVVAIRLRRMEARVAEMNPARPFWATLQTKLAADLLHPSPQFQEMDDLIKALENLTITDEQRVRLRDLLIERTTSSDPEVSTSEQSSAKIMLEAMDKVLEEAASSSPLTNIQMVGTKAAEAAKEEKPE